MYSYIAPRIPSCDTTPADSLRSAGVQQQALDVEAMQTVPVKGGLQSNRAAFSVSAIGACVAMISPVRRAEIKLVAYGAVFLDHFL